MPLPPIPDNKKQALLSKYGVRPGATAETAPQPSEPMDEEPEDRMVPGDEMLYGDEGEDPSEEVEAVDPERKPPHVRDDDGLVDEVTRGRRQNAEEKIHRAPVVDRMGMREAARKITGGRNA